MRGPAGLSMRAYAERLRASSVLPEGMANDATDAADDGNGQSVVAALRRRVPDAAVVAAGRIVGTVAVPLSQRRARQVAGRGPVRLNLGCGHHHLEGWVNVDLSVLHADLLWDLRRPLPFPPGSVEAVFLEHVLEHLPLSSGLDLLAQIRTLLAPGGIARIGVPDFGRYARSYATDRSFVNGIRPGRRTAMLALNEVAYCYGHLSLWDSETLAAALDETGFARVSECNFGESAIEPAPDQERHRDETLYMEASAS